MEKLKIVTNGNITLANINPNHKFKTKMTLSENEKSYLKGYAYAIQHIMQEITGDNTCGKSYDPLEIDDKYLHSYSFNLKDGGRHHPLEDYNSIEEITELMLKEGKEWIDEYINEISW